MFLQHLLNGITIGCSYALIALGYILASILPALPFFQSNRLYPNLSDLIRVI